MNILKHLIVFALTSHLTYGQIISYELMESWSLSQVSALYNQYGIPESVGEINYPVDGYKVLYFTPDYNGELVICSGAIFLPSGIGCNPPILSWQHGTESEDTGAPSNVGNNFNDLVGVISASHGYVVTMSDFIGLGEGEGFHNYVHANTEASSTIDLIIYGKEFATEQLGIAPNNQLFLIGYSQGGHATMATVKEIEENYSNQLTVSGSCPMAGPYSMSQAQRLMLEAGNPYPNPGYLPYVLFAYNKIYNLYDDINDVLISPYNIFLYSMYDGTNPMWQINNTLPDIPIDIFQESYYEEYLSNDNHPFKLALIDNDTYEFLPQSPMRLIHCSGDDNVTYENSEIAYNYFIESGVQNVDLIDGGSLNHTECAGPAILAAKIWVDELAELCQPTSLEDTSNRIKKDVIGTIDFLGRLIPDNTYNKNKISIYSNGSYQKEMILK